MIIRYVASSEDYKGFTLEVVMTQAYGHPAIFHRSCNIIMDGTCIAISKTKKEAKDLIDYGCFKN